GEFPAQVHGAARMHAEELAHVIAVERNEVSDLLSLRLGKAQPLAGFDLEADVTARRNRSWHSRLQHRSCTAHSKGSFRLCQHAGVKRMCDPLTRSNASMILVPLLNPKFANIPSRPIVRTSGSRHWSAFLTSALAGSTLYRAAAVPWPSASNIRRRTPDSIPCRW